MRSPLLALAIAAMMLVPASAGAATTIGSSLQATPTAKQCAAASTCTLSMSALPGATLTSPIDGVIVLWRIKTGNFPNLNIEARLHILHDNTDVEEGELIHVPEKAGTIETKSHVPIKQGDRIGLDGGGVVLAATPGAVTQLWGDGLSPTALQPNETRLPDSTLEGEELLLNADIEPDADHDEYGDETQDGCPTDPNSISKSSCEDKLKTGPTKTVPKKCKKGFVKKTVKGKKRCVRRHRHKPRHHQPHRIPREERD